MALSLVADVFTQQGDIDLDAIESLQKSPREAKFYRALYHTYLHLAPSQEKAAEILDVSIATFHCHLKAGITRVTEILWHQEMTYT